MHKSEDILIKEKITNLRQQLNEYVSRGDLISAINDRKVIKILYKGEDTKKVGWRTVEPYVLGTSTAGNIVLRGWQQAGDSDGFNGIGRTPRKGHERWDNYHEKPVGEVAGWRLFRLDGIKQILYTDVELDLDKVPPKYNPNDDGMTSIIASALPVKSDNVVQKGVGKISANINPNASVFDKQSNSWKLIPKDNKYEELRLKNNIKNAVAYVTGKQKENTGRWLLVKNGENYIPVRDNINNQNKYGDNIVGNLKDLNIKYFGGGQPLTSVSKANLRKNKRDFEIELQKQLQSNPQSEI